MNRSTRALAAAGALVLAAAAQAETTLYGSARLGVSYTDLDKNFRGVEYPNGNFSDVKNEASRLGVKGSEDLGGGLSAIYQYEFGVNADGSNDGSGNPLGQRLSWVGLKGGFGSVTLGRQWSPYYNAVGLGDVWNSDDTALSYYALGIPHRISNALIYASPSFSGLGVSGAIVVDGQGNDLGGVAEKKDGIDMYDVAVSYVNGPLTLGAAYRGCESVGCGEGGRQPNSTVDRIGFPADSSVWGVAGSYEFGGVFKLIATFQRADLGEIDAEPMAYDLTGEYKIGNGIARAAWGRVDLDDDGVDDDQHDIWKVGYQHDLSRRTRLWFEYVDSEFATGGGNVANAVGDVYSNVSIGMRHDF